MSTNALSHSEPRRFWRTGRDSIAVLAVMVIALAVPFYAVQSYEGTIAISLSRWLAFPVLIAQILVVLLAFASGWRVIASWKELPGNVKIAFGGWLIVASYATAFATYQSYSILFQMIWVIQGLFAWALWSMLGKNWRSARSAILMTFAIGLLIHSLMIYTTAWVIQGPHLKNWGAYLVGTNNPRMYIYYANALLGLGMGLLISSQQRRLTIFAIILLFAAYHLYAWAGGRNSIGVSLVIPFLVAMMTPHWKRVLTASLSCAMIAYPLSLITAPSHHLFGFKAQLGDLANTAGQVTEGGFSSGRLQMWRALIEHAFDKPFFGHGQVGTMGAPEGVREAAGMAINPHNALVHIFHAWGLAGLVIFAIGLLPFVPTIRARLIAEPVIAWPAFIILLAQAATSGLDGTLFYTQPLFFCALSFALLASVPAGPPKSAQKFG